MTQFFEEASAPAMAGHPAAMEDGSAHSLVKVVDVRRADVTGSPVLDYVIDLPTVGATSATHVLDFHGWVLGRHGAVPHILVQEDGYNVRCIPVNVARPDVLAAYPHAIPQTCGFQSRLAYLGANTRLTYHVFAAPEGCPKVKLCELDVEVGPMGDFRRLLPPLILTTLGRSGSTYVMGLLARHPEIVAYDPFKYETRIAKYWIDLFAAIAQPASFLQMITPFNANGPHWWLGIDEPPQGSTPPEHHGMTFLAGEHINDLAGMCLSRIDAFFRGQARVQGKPRPRFFVEKQSPDRSTELMRNLFPLWREVVLVRDLRDMICSMLAFNRKRGYAAFDRDKVQSDEEYMPWLRKTVCERLLAATTRKAAGHDGRATVLRYEDMVQRPHETLRALLSFLGLDRSDAVIAHMTAPVPAEVFANHVTSGDPARSIGRWRREFTPSMRAAFREHLEDISLNLGYEPTE